MAIPADIQPLLSSKKSRECCDRAEWFCVPVLRGFRFLIDDHGFRVKEVSHARHDIWVTFRNAEIEVSLAVEVGCDRWGHIRLLKDARSNYQRHSLYFHEILPRFHPNGKLPRFTFDDQDEELSLWVTLVNEHWSEIISHIADLAEEKENKAKKRKPRQTSKKANNKAVNPSGG